MLGSVLTWNYWLRAQTPTTPHLADKGAIVLPPDVSHQQVERPLTLKRGGCNMYVYHSDISAQYVHSSTYISVTALHCTEIILAIFFLILNTKCKENVCDLKPLMDGRWVGELNKKAGSRVSCGGDH